MLSAKMLLLAAGGACAVAAIGAFATRSSEGNREPGGKPSIERPSTSLKPPQLSPLPALTLPPTDPTSCDAARASVEALLAWLEQELSADQRAEIEGRARALTTAPDAVAWNDLGIAYYLQGDVCAASWCGLHAVRLEWHPRQVANCGVFLMGANRLSEAHGFLLCAYSLGSRSPYLLEALSTLHKLLGEDGRAREYIAIANALLPADPLIHAARRILEGEDPFDTEERERDALDEALEELQRLHARVVRRLELLAQQLDEIEKDPETKQFRNQFVEITLQGYELPLANAIDQVRRARFTPAEYAAEYGVAERSRGFEQSYGGYMHAAWNQALSACAQGYLMLADEILCLLGAKNLDTPGFRILFWAEAMDTSPIELGEELRLEWNSSSGQVERDERCDDYGFDEPYWVEYARAYTESERRWEVQWRACNDDPCRGIADQGHCRRVSDAYRALIVSGTRRLNRCAADYHRVAIGRLMDGESELRGAADYLRRCLARMELTFPGEAEMYPAMFAESYQRLIERLTDEEISYGVAARLAEEARAFDQELSSHRERYQGEREDISRGHTGTYGTTNGCAELPAPEWRELVIEPYRVFLAQLRARVHTDFRTDAQPIDSSCRLRVASCVLAADADGRVLAEQQCLDSRGCGGPFEQFAVAVSAGDELGSSSILVAQPRPGRGWDYSLALTAPASGNPDQRRSLFGHSWTLALPCFPQAIPPHFTARAILPGAGRALQQATTRN